MGKGTRKEGGKGTGQRCLYVFSFFFLSTELLGDSDASIGPRKSFANGLVVQ